MDPVTLILTALAAGAALGVKDTASQAVMDAYTTDAFPVFGAPRVLTTG